MKRVGHYLLAYLCCLLLIAPAGWCCFVPSMVQAQEVAEPTCPHCQQHAAPTEPEEPAPTKPIECPCMERQAPAPTFQKVEPDLDVALVHEPVITPSTSALSAPQSVVSVDSLLSLHLLHCVWLC